MILNLEFQKSIQCGSESWIMTGPYRKHSKCFKKKTNQTQNDCIETLPYTYTLHAVYFILEIILLLPLSPTLLIYLPYKGYGSLMNTMRVIHGLSIFGNQPVAWTADVLHDSVEPIEGIGGAKLDIKI